MRIHATRARREKSESHVLTNIVETKHVTTSSRMLARETKLLGYFLTFLEEQLEIYTIGTCSMCTNTIIRKRLVEAHRLRMCEPCTAIPACASKWCVQSQPREKWKLRNKSYSIASHATELLRFVQNTHDKYIKNEMMLERAKIKIFYWKST